MCRICTGCDDYFFTSNQFQGIVAEGNGIERKKKKKVLSDFQLLSLPGRGLQMVSGIEKFFTKSYKLHYSLSA